MISSAEARRIYRRLIHAIAEKEFFPETELPLLFGLLGNLGHKRRPESLP